MQNKENKIREALTAGFPGDKIEVIDYAGDQDHFLLKINSARFNNLKLVDRQRLVFKTLGPLVAQTHAFQFELLSPETV